MNDSMELIASPSFKSRNERLPPEVNRILYVKNLPFKMTDEELFEVFGRYGAIYQIRKGVTNETRGTAFVIYEDIFEAKAALEALSGYMLGGRYLVVLYYQKEKNAKRKETEKEKE